MDKQLYIVEYDYKNFHSSSWWEKLSIKQSPIEEHGQFVRIIEKDCDIEGVILSTYHEILPNYYRKGSNFEDKKDVLLSLNGERQWIYRSTVTIGFKDAYDILVEKRLTRLSDHYLNEDEIEDEIKHIINTEKTVCDSFGGVDHYHW